MLGDAVEMSALDIGPQLDREERQIVQRDGDGDAIGGGGNADFVVRPGHLDGQADDLPWRGQPLHHQRQRERQQLRRLQGGEVERSAYHHDLLIRKHPQVAGKPAAEGVERFAGLQDERDRQQIRDHIGRTDAGQRALLVAALHRRGNLEDCISGCELQFADRRFEIGRRAAVARRPEHRFEFARLLRRAVADQPLPYRQQRGAADLARPHRKIGFDEKGLERAE